jgi:hypothetical protein
MLRCFDDGDECTVECVVYPMDDAGSGPVHPGPYSFASRDDATAFVEEATLALEYLGCEVS